MDTTDGELAGLLQAPGRRYAVQMPASLVDLTTTAAAEASCSAGISLQGDHFRAPNRGPAQAARRAALPWHVGT